jgi:Zn-dependent protease with chaperone function
LTVGSTRAVQPREGCVLREEPNPLGKKVRTLPYGTEVKVVETKDLWAKVEAAGGGPGWARVSEIVEPSALTGAAAYRGSLSSADVTAAGRQFSEKIEKTYRTMIPAEMNQVYALVDQVERTKPTDAEVDAFIAEGGLGGDAGRAAVREAAANVRAAGTMDDQGPRMRPITDEDFVHRLLTGFSPEQEYWLGRSVAAKAIHEYGLDPDAGRQALVKKVGAALARLSDRTRQTWGGYHFGVLNSDTANGIAGPGGFVLVTRGAVKLARNEDELAGILAHEMGHVSRKHGEQMIRKMRDWEAQMQKLRDAAEKPPRMRGECGLCAEMAKALGVASNGLVGQLDKEAYARDMEFEADMDGTLTLLEVGYRVGGVAEYLESIPSRKHAQWTTHPSSDDRIKALKPLVDKYGKPMADDPAAQKRLPRFQQGSGPAVPAKTSASARQ